MADFPATKKTFSQVVDGVTFLEAILFNTGYNEVEAIQTLIGALGAGNTQSFSTSLNDLLGSYRRDCVISFDSVDSIAINTGAISFEDGGGKIRLRRNTSPITADWSDLDTGSEGDGTYYVYAVADTAATTFSILISLNSSAPAGATYYRRLGSFQNSGGNIVQSSVIDDSVFDFNIGDHVAILSGTIGHGGTIPLPSGFSESQCKWMVSVGYWDGGLDGGACDRIIFTANGTRTVTAQGYDHNWVDGGSTQTISGTANYIIIGIK